MSQATGEKLERCREALAPRRRPLTGLRRRAAEVLALLLCVSGLLVANGLTPTAASATGTWSGPTNIAPYGQSISCPTSNFCVAVDDAGGVYTYNGSTWSAPAAPDATSYFYSVSCVSSSFCVAGDAADRAFVFNGVSWSGPTTIATDYIVSVSCVTTSFCVAASDGNVTIFNGSSWSAPDPVDASHLIYSVSCMSTSFCVVGDDAGNVLTYNGSSWSAPIGVSSNALLVSCSSTAFCLAHDYFGDVSTFNGTSWSAPTPLALALTAISCTGSVVTADGPFCIGVDGSGNEITYSGGSWAAPIAIDGSTFIDSVSCANESFCVAFDSTGNVLTYTNNVAAGGTTCSSRCTTTVSIPATSSTRRHRLSRSREQRPLAPGSANVNVTFGTLICPTVNPAQAPITDLTDSGFAPTVKLTLTVVLKNTSRPRSRQVCFNSTVPSEASEARWFPRRASPATQVLKDSQRCSLPQIIQADRRQRRGRLLRSGRRPTVPHRGPHGSFQCRASPAGGNGDPVVSAQLFASGGTLPYHWKVTSGSLPHGIKLNAKTGALSGAAKQTGTYSFGITVSDHEKPPVTSQFRGASK